MSTTLDEAREALAGYLSPVKIKQFEALARAVAEEVYTAALERLGALSDLGSALADIGLDGGDFDEEITRSRAPVGEDGVRYETVTVTDHGDGFDISRADQERLGLVGDQHYEIVEFLSDRRATIAIPTPPAKDTGEGAAQYLKELIAKRRQAKSGLDDCSWFCLTDVERGIADLERRLAEAANELHCCDDVPLDKGLAEGIASLRRERDEARSSLETAERRIGELEKAHDRALVLLGRHAIAMPDLSAVISWLEHGCDPAKAVDELRVYEKRIATLTPGAGTARSEDEEGK